MQQQGVPFKNCLLNGSVEVAPSAGLATAICDLVSSGATLEANGLKEVEVIYRSKACLIQRAEPLDAENKHWLTAYSPASKVCNKPLNPNTLCCMHQRIN